MPLMANEENSLTYVFWQGPAHLIAGQVQHDVNCRVFLEGSPKDLRIETESPLGFNSLGFINGEALSIEIAGVSRPIELIPVHPAFGSQGANLLTFGLRRSPIWFMKSERLSSARTAILNFAHYWMGTPAPSRFELKACGWTAHFIPISDKTLVIAKMLHCDKYRVTHQVEFARDDGSLFTGIDAQDFLGKLSLFLSFCRGQWVATSFTVGLNSNGEVALEQWGTGRVTPWREPDGWLDEHHGDAICHLYKPFCERLQDGSWNHTVSQIVYWFARAQTDNVGPDGACILLQAALERFAWHFLVRERKAISEKGFRDLAAADQLRIMLNMLAVPAAIPAGLVQLKALAKARGFDGPEVFTFIRNRLVHPPKASAAPEQLPYYEAYCLAKWYVELVVLSACGYLGEYGNRTITGRWIGQVENVPWA
jgi:hypothetical protein